MNNVWFWGTSYIIPNVDSVVLGGTAQKGNWDTTVSAADTEKIMNDICAVFPSMKDAAVVQLCIFRENYRIFHKTNMQYLDIYITINRSFDRRDSSHVCL